MKTALVTGATRGIGKAIAEKLKADNYEVLGTATSDSGVDTLNSNGIEGHLLDLNSKDSIEIFWSKLESDNKTISVLVNNAGITRDNILLRMKEDEWEDIINTNLSSIYKMSKSVLRGMIKKRSGRIISITSVVGAMGNAGQSNYAATKAGIIGMTKSLAIEYAKKNITLNCVSPGFIQSRMTDNKCSGILNILKSQFCIIGRISGPDDVQNDPCTNPRM